MNYKLYLSILLAFVFVFSSVLAVNDYDVSVAVSPKSITTKPCGIATYDIIVNNLGGLQDTYTVTVNGIPSDWYTLSSDSVTIGPSGSDKVYLFITPNCYENKFGQFNGSITLTGQANATATDKFTLIVVPDHILTLTLPTIVTVCSGEEQDLVGILGNIGNYTEDVTFTASGDASAFVKVPEEKVTINVGKKSNVTITLDPVGVDLGSYSLTINAQSVTGYASASASTVVNVVNCYDVQVTVPEQVQTCTGKEKTFDMVIKNTGMKNDTYTVTIPDLSYTNDVTLDAGKSTILNIGYTNEVEGTYEVAYTVESAFVKKEGTITFVITKCYGVDLTVEENEVEIQSGTGKLVKGKVTNTGLFADTFKIISDVLWSSIRPAEVNLTSNQSKDVYAYYSPEYGASGTYYVNLTAKSGNSQDTKTLTIDVVGGVTTTTEKTTTTEETTIPTNETTTTENVTTTEETTQPTTQPTGNETTSTESGGIPTGDVIKAFWENRVMRALLISIIIVVIILIIIYLVVMR